MGLISIAEGWGLSVVPQSFRRTNVLLPLAKQTHFWGLMCHTSPQSKRTALPMWLAYSEFWLERFLSLLYSLSTIEIKMSIFLLKV